MRVLDVLLATLGGLAVMLGLSSKPLRHLPITEPLVALVAGIAIGPAVLGLAELPPDQAIPVLHVAARLSLAMSLMAVALRFPTRTYRRMVGTIGLLVAVVMLLMAVTGAALALVLTGVPLATAAVLGSALAPTDPVLSSSVVSGKPAEQGLPERLRAVISGESGANDALAFPMVFVAMAAVSGQSLVGGIGSAMSKVAIGVVLGVAVGYGAGRLVVVAERHHDLEQSAFLTLTLALALFTLGTVSLAGGEGILGVLAAGLAYSHAIEAAERREEWRVQEAINRFLILPVFTMLGMALPLSAWRGLGWGLPLFTVAILVLRRLPWLLLLRRPLGLSRPDAVFAGWFGPVGVAALFYLSMVQEDTAVSETVWAAGIMVIVASTFLHGVTAAPGRRWYARHRDASSSGT